MDVLRQCGSGDLRSASPPTRLDCVPAGVPLPSSPSRPAGSRETPNRSPVGCRPRPSDGVRDGALLLQTLRRHGFPEPELQFELRDAAGRVIARTDAALVDWKILLE